MSAIGVLNEKPLHASLKTWYAQPNDRFEVPLDGYVIDIVRDDLLIEIQTKSFASMKSKLNKLIHTHPIRLVHPIAQEKWILKLATTEDGDDVRRKSPKRGRVEDVFWELVSFPHLLTHDNFSLEVLMIREEEVWRYVGNQGHRRRGWRKRGWRTEERRLLEVVAQHRLDTYVDWLALLPDSLPETFTTKELAEGLGIRRALAQKMAYCLREMKVIDVLGKQGRSILYQVMASG
ncbi:MAG: hypothetical protein AAF639_46695 [Chloroflexota bacterium]